jgi:hypothetical protein
MKEMKTMNKYVLLPITNGSFCLTIGLVLEEQAEKIKVQLISTPSTMWTSIWREIPEPKPLSLEDRENKATDCIGRVIKPGMNCLYIENKEIKEGKITECLSDLWVMVDENKKIRNVSTYIY